MSCDPPRKPPNPPSIITGKPGARSGDIVPLTLSGGAVVAAAVSTPVMSHAVVIDGRVVLVGGGSGAAGCLTYSIDGTLFADTGDHRLYVESDTTITKVRASVGTAPTGSAVAVDVNKNGTSILSSAISISAGSNTATATPTTTALSAGDYLTVDVDSVGSTTAGANLVVQVWTA